MNVMTDAGGAAMSATTNPWSWAEATFNRHAIREQSDNSVFICRVHDDGDWDTTWWANIVFVKGPHGSGNLVITGDFDHLVVKHRFTSLRDALGFVAGGAPDSNCYMWQKIRDGMSGYSDGMYEFSAWGFVQEAREALEGMMKEDEERLSVEQLALVDAELECIEVSDAGQQEAICRLLDALPAGGDWHEWVSGDWGLALRPHVRCALAACCRAHELLEAASRGQEAEVQP